MKMVLMEGRYKGMGTMAMATLEASLHCRHL